MTICDDPVGQARVLVDPHIAGGDHPGAVHDHPIHDAGAAPPSPPGHTDKAHRPPPGDHRLSPAEGNPRDGRRGYANGYRTSVEEGDQGRRVHGRGDDRSRGPRPRASQIHPAPVMVRNPAPGGVVDPCPAEVGVPGPLAGTVGSPIDRNPPRHPHRSVRLHRPPRASLIEVPHTGYARRQVSRARRPQQIIGALVVPAVPIIHRRGAVCRNARGIGLVDHYLFTRAHLRGLPARGHDHSPATSPGHEHRPDPPDLDAIVAGTLDRQRRRRRVDLDDVTGIQIAEIEANAPRGDVELHEISFEVRQSDLRLPTCPQEDAPPDLQFEARARSGIQPVAGGHGNVQARRNPVLGPGPPEGDLPFGEPHPGRSSAVDGRSIRHPRWRPSRRRYQQRRGAHRAAYTGDALPHASGLTRRRFHPGNTVFSEHDSSPLVAGGRLTPTGPMNARQFAKLLGAIRAIQVPGGMTDSTPSHDGRHDAPAGSIPHSCGRLEPRRNGTAGAGCCPQRGESSRVTNAALRRRQRAAGLVLSAAILLSPVTLSCCSPEARNAGGRSTSDATREKTSGPYAEPRTVPATAQPFLRDRGYRMHDPGEPSDGSGPPAPDGT